MITDAQFLEAANTLKCGIAAIKTVYQIEAAGQGYLTDGRVKILFEGHRFWKSLNKVGFNDNKLTTIANLSFDNTNVLYKNWDKSKYKGGVKEWIRMSVAIAICKDFKVDPEIALDSASYGSFQIMGENSKLCDYNTAHEMLAAYNTGGEAEQLKSFCKFVINSNLGDELRAHNWTGFAKGYNGTGYRENKYDIKMAALYAKLSRA